MDGMVAVFLFLSDIIARLKEDPALTPARRRDLVSAVLRMCEIVGVDPQITPASLQYMRPFINKVRPAKHNLRPKTWSNLRANFRAAIVHALPRPAREPDRAWEKLRTALPDKYMRYGLSRFIGYYEREKKPPTAVCDTALPGFLAYLENDAQVTDPRACLRRACRLWNVAVDTVDGWPQGRLSLPDHRRPRRTLRLSLQEELRECLAPPCSGDRFAKDGHKKVRRAATIARMTAEVELSASALVEAGWDPPEITSLKCLVELHAFETILRRYCHGDKEQTPRPTARTIASTLITLAKDVLGSGPAALEQIGELRRLQGCLGPQSHRPSAKNQRFLRELHDAAILAKLLLLPERLANWAARAAPARGALAMELAVAIAILLVAPMRRGNLTPLRLDRHLVRPGGPLSGWLIDIPPEEVKNEVPLLYELSQRVTTVVNRHIRDFRPMRAQPGNPYLFPVGSTHKSPAVLSAQIKRVIATWVGIDMTPHQFRHLAGFLMQKNRPGSFAALAQLLGHKDIRTTIRYYAEPDTISAGREFDAIIEAELARARLPRRSRLERKRPRRRPQRSPS